jgi:anti-anti-sigma regulatory factor
MAARSTSRKKAVGGRGAGKAKKTAATKVDFGKTLTIAQVADWQQKLSGIFDLREPVSLDAGDIEKIDGAGLQLLVALMKEAEAAGVPIEWRACSEVLQQNAIRIGLGHVLHLET